MDRNSSGRVAKLANIQGTQKQKDRQVVLVLQGGGALGAYQAGVYHALHEHEIEPDWIVGTSIGAINASLIAGNPRESRLERLKEFWTRMAYRPPFNAPAWTGLPDVLSYWRTILRGIPDFFAPNPGAFLGTHVPLGSDAAGFYSTSPLEKTLLELVDFSLVNKCNPRLTVGAAHVRRVESRPVEIGTRGIEVLLAERLAVRADAGRTRIPVLADTARK